MKERTFAMNLTPHGAQSTILMDGEDISGLLRAVSVSSSATGETSVELHPSKACLAELIAKVDEAHVVVVDDSEAYRTLDRWLKHDDTCAFENDYGLSKGLCICGLNEALKKLKL